MSTIILNSEKPQYIGRFTVSCKEYCQYLYYPAIMAHSGVLHLEPRLEWLREMINHACFDHFKKLNNDREFQKLYVYLTVKQTLVPKGLDQNRPGWHSDGFGTDDVQYIFFDRWPTEFLIGRFEVRDDDVLSMEDMENYAQEIAGKGYMNDRIYQPEPFHLYRIDQNHIHRTVPTPENGIRMFVKITISKHVYAQEGNSRNYLINYDWDYKPRKAERNQPHQ